MNAFIHHFGFEFRAGIRHKQLLVMNYLFPVGYYLLMGFIMAGINPQFREDLIPAMIIFSSPGCHPTWDSIGHCHGAGKRYLSKLQDQWHSCNFNIDHLRINHCLAPAHHDCFYHP